MHEEVRGRCIRSVQGPLLELSEIRRPSIRIGEGATEELFCGLLLNDDVVVFKLQARLNSTRWETWETYRDISPEANAVSKADGESPTRRVDVDGGRVCLGR